MRAFVLLMVSPMVVAGSASHAQLFFSHDPVTLDNLDGNYRTIAACAYQHLAPRKSGLSRTDYPEQGVVRLSSNTWSERWELSFVKDGGGRQTRLDWTGGAYPSEFVLSTVRACAA
ncbi:MAG TPA: hypothetical protein VH678_01655 [Xanthobacteraceae bacterium]